MERLFRCRPARPGSAGIAVSANASARATVNESAGSAIARDSLRVARVFTETGKLARPFLPATVQGMLPLSPSLSSHLPSNYSLQSAHETCFFLAKACAPVFSLFLSFFFTVKGDTRQ